MENQEFINKLAEKLRKLGTVRPLGFHYLHPYKTAPADSIICNGATYPRAVYKDFFDYITTQGWVKTEAEWQEIATRDNGFCPFYSSGDGSTNFRTPKFNSYQQIALASDPDKTYSRLSTVQPESHEWVMCVVAYSIATNVGSVDIQNVMAAVYAVQAQVNGIPTPRSYITETYVSGTQGYRAWSDGFIEQWGKANVGENYDTVITFQKPFRNADYNIQTAGWYITDRHACVMGKTATTVSFRGWRNDNDWYAFGY